MNAHTTPPVDLVEAALAYARRGVRIFPVNVAAKVPAISNAEFGRKVGREIKPGEGGFKVSLEPCALDEAFVVWMFRRRNATGIAMPCGKVNDVIVLDIDLHKTGPAGANARAVYERFEDEIQSTHLVRTQSGGLHGYFAYRPGHSKNELGSGVEVQTDGAYVLLPPSKNYRVAAKVDREDWPIPPWPPSAAGGGTRGETYSPDEAVPVLATLIAAAVSGESITPSLMEAARILTTGQDLLRWTDDHYAATTFLSAIIEAGRRTRPSEAARLDHAEEQILSGMVARYFTLRDRAAADMLADLERQNADTRVEAALAAVRRLTSAEQRDLADYLARTTTEGDQ